MTATNQNIKIFRGDTQTIAVELTAVNGDAFSLSPGGTLKYAVRETSHDTDSVIAKESGSGILLVDGNVAEISIDHVDSDLPSGIYYHQLDIFDLGDVSTALVGAFVVIDSMRMPAIAPAAMTASISAALRCDAVKV